MQRQAAQCCPHTRLCTAPSLCELMSAAVDAMDAVNASAAGGVGLIVCPSGASRLSSGQCLSSSVSASSSAGGWSEWVGDWWLIPLLVVLVVLCERLYSVCRHQLSSRSSSVDSSQFSVLQQTDAGDAMDDSDDDDVGLHQDGLTDSDTGHTQHTQPAHSPAAGAATTSAAR